MTVSATAEPFWTRVRAALGALSPVRSERPGIFPWPGCTAAAKDARVKVTRGAALVAEKVIPPGGLEAIVLPWGAGQSFAIGQADGLWLLVGGRRNGFHRTSDRESTFPSAW